MTSAQFLTSAEFWRLAVAPLIALLAGVTLANLTRRWARRDKAVQDEVALKAEQMKSERGYRDELRAENKDLREENRQLHGKLDNAIETIRVQGERIIRLELTLSGFAADVAEEMEDIHAQLEKVKINGDLMRQVLGMAKKARETSSHWGPAGQLKQEGG